MKYKLDIKDALKKWNNENPTLRKKTLKDVSEYIGVSSSALIQMEKTSQFQKHFAVIFESKDKKAQQNLFELYITLGIPFLQKLKKITKYLDCKIFDIIKN